VGKVHFWAPGVPAAAGPEQIKAPATNAPSHRCLAKNRPLLFMIFSLR
jgi:hypothetical protein